MGDAPGARPGAQRLAGRRGAGRRGDRAADGRRSAGDRDRLQPADHRARPDRACRNRRAAPRRPSAGQLPAARADLVCDAGAVRDVRDGDDACADQAGRLRRRRPEDRRRRLGDQPVRFAAAEPPQPLAGRRAGGRQCPVAARLLCRAARPFPATPRQCRAACDGRGAWPGRSGRVARPIPAGEALEVHELPLDGPFDSRER